MNIPGAAACHAIISDECRTNRGDEDALFEAFERCEKAYNDVVAGWPVGKGVKIHVVLLVERP